MEGGLNKTKIDLIFEKIPPLIGILLIFTPLILSYFDVDLAAAMLIATYIYFFYKSVSMTIMFAMVLRRINKAINIDWNALTLGLRDPEKEIVNLEQQLKDIKALSFGNFKTEIRKHYSKYNSNSRIKLPLFFQRVIYWQEKRSIINFIKDEIAVLKNINLENHVSPDELQHVIIVPHVKEPESILRDTLNHLKNQTFNTKQINVVLAAEAVDPNGIPVSEKLKEEYKDVFNNIWITSHKLAHGEIVGKSANMNWAGRQAHKYITELGWDLKKTTITSCDADSKLDPNYYAYLSYKYITSPNREYKFYSTAMVFYNNIWRIPFYARVKNSFHTVINTAHLIRSDRLVPFSTYSTSYWLMEQIAFWDPWITPEDYHIFFKSLFKFNKEVSTIPMFMKTLSDAAEGTGHWQTITNNYKQSRRWGWGISDDGWMLKNLLQNFFKFSLRAKYLTAHVLFDHIFGFSLAFLTIFGVALPSIFNPEFSNQTTGALLPVITEQIIQLTLVFLVIVIVLDVYLRPTPGGKRPAWKKFIGIFEWIIQPFTTFFLTAIPTFEAQTRLVFGKYLDYYVTIKKGDEEEKS